MNLLEKLKETSISVVPILLIVFVLNLTVAPVGWPMFVQFVIGGVLIILGLGVFLLGTDIGVLPVGRKVGSALVRRRSLALMLAVGLAVGFLITVAEPDVQVLASQAATVDPAISKLLLVLMIAVGVGFFVAVGFGRVILGVPYRLLLVLFYGAVFLLAYLTAPEYLGIAFDAGGATTGPMTVPFIMALGVGVAAVRTGKNAEQDSFGLVGLASIGPIIAVLAMGVIAKDGVMPAVSHASAAAAERGGIAWHFLRLVPDTIVEIFQALGPLTAMFVVFQVFLIRMPRHQVFRMVIGLLYSFFGLLLFLVGVHGGFMPVGSTIGAMIGGYSGNGVLVPIGLVLGAVVVLAEPAVWVLNAQVEEVSGGHIKKQILLLSLSVGVALAVGIAMLRVVTGMSIWWFLIPGYALALTLTFFCPPMFTAIAFDSGGVASGPMSSTFILSFTIGASTASGGNPVTDAFGVIAMIAMIPLVTIQLLGLVVRWKEKKAAVLRAEEPAKDTQE